MNDFANQYQLQGAEEQSRANSNTGTGIGTGAEIAADIGEAGIFIRRQTIQPIAEASSDAASDIAESAGEIAGNAAEAGGALLECAEAGGSIIQGIVSFIGECIGAIGDGV